MSNPRIGEPLKISTIHPSNPRLKEISLAGIRVYLQSIGWRLTDHPNKSLLVFVRLDDSNSPIEIVPPVDETSFAYVCQLSETINVLSFLQDRPTEEVMDELEEFQLHNYHRTYAVDGELPSDR